MVRNMHTVTVEKTENAARYLPMIRADEADAEFYRAAAENDGGFYRIQLDAETAGLAQMICGGTAFVYLYIFPAYRRRGCGLAAFALLEQQLRDGGAKKIVTSYGSGDALAAAFAARCGFHKQFESDYMVYEGPGFPPEENHVREYRDEDYPAAHRMYAEAFHRMRMETGWFPDSIPEPPNERMRQYWAETAGERLVWEEDGKIAGYAHIDGNELGSISVDPAMQGRGIGRRFAKEVINRILAECGTVSLYCVVGNRKARNLYDSLGFKAICRGDYAEKRL